LAFGRATARADGAVAAGLGIGVHPSAALRIAAAPLFGVRARDRTRRRRRRGRHPLAFAARLFSPRTGRVAARPPSCPWATPPPALAPWRPVWAPPAFRRRATSRSRRPRLSLPALRRRRTIPRGAGLALGGLGFFGRWSTAQQLAGEFFE